MFRFSIVVLLFGVLYTTYAHAAGYQVTTEDRKQWYSGEWQNHMVFTGATIPSDLFCAGNVADIFFDTNNNDSASYYDKLTAQLYENKYSKGAAYYIAHDFAANGYKFCKTYVSADRVTLSELPQVEYWYSKTLNETPDCFWLCKPGFYSDGTGCTSTTMTDTSIPDLSDMFVYSGSQPLTATGFRYKKLVNQIPKLWGSLEVRCAKAVAFVPASQAHVEHVVLAISEILVNADTQQVTYTVQPMAIRAVGLGYKYTAQPAAADTAWALVSFPDGGVKDNTMCPGNMIHKDGGGCHASSEISEYQAAKAKASALEEQGLAILCQGWPKEKYDNKIHTLQSATFKYENWRIMPDDYDENDNSQKWTYGDATATCTIFVCKAEGMGYKDNPVVNSNFNCVSCVENDDTTINPLRLGAGSDGVCKECKVGEILKNGECVDADSIHKFYMNGIKDKDATEDRKLSEQCWTKPTPDEYIKCMEETKWVAKKK